MAGYSAKPLFEKLGLKTGMHVLVIHAPTEYGNIIGRENESNIHVAQSLKQGKSYDFIHLFVQERHVLESYAPKLVHAMAPHTMLWISWPKRSANVPTDISEQTLRDVLLPLGIVDVKVCAIDEVWSGLKFVHRKTKK